MMVSESEKSVVLTELSFLPTVDRNSSIVSNEKHSALVLQYFSWLPKFNKILCLKQTTVLVGMLYHYRHLFTTSECLG